MQQRDFRQGPVLCPLLEEDFPNAKKAILVCDNFNVVFLAHSLGAFYETFEPGIARSLARRLEIVPTPKYGSWLNIAENELSTVTRQCVPGRRFETIKKLRDEVAASAKACNSKQKGVQWQLKVENARIKLKSIYPKIKY